MLTLLILLNEDEFLPPSTVEKVEKQDPDPVCGEAGCGEDRYEQHRTQEQNMDDDNMESD